MSNSRRLAVNPRKCYCHTNGSVEGPNNTIIVCAVGSQEIHFEMLFVFHGLNRTNTYYAKSPEPSAWQRDFLLYPHFCGFVCCLIP